MADQQPEDPAAGAPEDGTAPAPEPTRIEAAGPPTYPVRIRTVPVDATRVEQPAEPTRAEAPARPAEPTQPADPAPVEGEDAAVPDGGGAEEAAVTEEAAPARWSGSAAVPEHVPKQAWWSRRRAQAAADGAAPAVDPWAGSEDWSATPAVDPWADQDTPWQLEAPFPEAMPPTRIDSPLPPTRREAGLPPTRSEAVQAPTRPEAPLPSTRAAAPVPSPRAGAAMPPTRMDAVLGAADAKATGSAPPAPAGPPASPGDEPRRRGWGRKKRAKEAPAQANRIPVQPRPATPPSTSPVAPSNQSARPALPSGQSARPAASSTRPNQAPPPWARPGQSAQPSPPWAPPSQPSSKAGKPKKGQKPLPTRPPAQRSPLPPPRRKRRWPRRLFFFTLLSAVCCCGVPGYYLWPAAQQYPVSASLPQSVADLDLRDDGASRRAVERLSDQLGGSSLVQGEVFAGAYADGDGKRVTLFGTTGLRLTPEDDVEAEIAHLSGEYSIENVEAYDLGETGVHERCGVGRSGGNAVVICAWADHGSLATVVMSRRNVAESAELTGVLRRAVLTRG